MRAVSRIAEVTSCTSIIQEFEHPQEVSKPMKALLLTTTDGPSSPQITEVETPTPAAGEVRVAIKYACLLYTSDAADES